ncbi:MAG TPA: hypothetical protein EYG20_09455 [Alcanivorax sp.]|uniref:hypothetical protein n=2 Tax=Alcanivorax TaxID=59753 RepID=UPI001A1282F1|nr:hypothetical protein [Alcanivorax sp.]HIL23496.1 hypothetical protein [Alcanivorax sp.]
MNRLATSNRRRQQGALTVITPLLLLIVVILSMMALDGARLYMLRGEMQAQVNVAAQAGAAEAQSCGGQFVSTAVIQSRALAAAQAQGFNAEDGTLQVEVGLIEDADGSNVLSFRPVNFVEESNAVLVTYTRSEPISLLLPESTFGTLDMSVNAAARREVTATISAAGSTAGLGGDESLLGSLLGVVLNQPGFSLDPTSLDSLENATVQLGDLLSALAVDDLTELLGLDADQLASAIADVGGVAAPVASLLDDIASSQGIETIKVSDIIEVVEATSVPEDSEFPVYDLVISLVLNLAEQQQAGQGGVLDLPLNINDLNIPLIADIETVDLGLHVGEPPTVAIGPARQDADGNWRTQFYAPDVTLQLRARAEILPINILGLVTFSLADLEIPLAVNAGGGRGYLVAADCAAGSSNTVEFTVELEREVARIVTGSLDSDGELQSSPLDADVGRLSLLFGLLSIDPLLHLDAELDGTVPGAEETVVLDPRYDLYCDPVAGCAEVGYEDLGSGLAGLNLGLTVNASLLEGTLGGISLGQVLNPVIDLIEDLLSDVVVSLGDALINPLLRTLGVGLGGISVNVSAANQDAIQVIENITVASAQG